MHYALFLMWTHLSALIVEALQEALQQLVSVVDPLCVLADDPDHGTASVRFIQRVEVLTQRGDDALVPEQHPYLSGPMGLLLKLHVQFVLRHSEGELTCWDTCGKCP